MARKVIWSRDASVDRFEVFDYWNKRLGTNTFSRKLNKLILRAENIIAEQPFSGRKVEGRDARAFRVKHYLIFYRVRDEIEVLRLWDSRRNPEDLKL
ncbi:MAG: type II toxin-antitoxin system RelE/ParE family toxin [Bacteroidota bacterium]